GEHEERRDDEPDDSRLVLAGGSPHDRPDAVRGPYRTSPAPGKGEMPSARSDGPASRDAELLTDQSITCHAARRWCGRGRSTPATWSRHCSTSSGRAATPGPRSTS